MRTRAIWILVGFCVASLIYSIMIGCGKKTPSEANGNGNGVVRKVYTGTAVNATEGWADISIPEVTLDDPPAISYYRKYATDVWASFDDGLLIKEGKVAVWADAVGTDYKIVVIK